MKDGGQPLPPPEPPDYAGEVDDEAPDDEGDAAGGEGFFAEVADPGVEEDDRGGSFFAPLVDPSVEDGDEEGGVFAEVADPAVEEDDGGGSFFAPLRGESGEDDRDAEVDEDGGGDVAETLIALADDLRQMASEGALVRAEVDRIGRETVGVVSVLIESAGSLESGEPATLSVERPPTFLVDVPIADPSAFLQTWDREGQADDLNRALIIRAVQEGLRQAGIGKGLDEIRRAYDELPASFNRTDEFWRERVEQMEPGSSIAYGIDRSTLTQVLAKIAELRALRILLSLEGDELRAGAPDYFSRVVAGAFTSFGLGVWESSRDLAEFAWSVSPVRKQIDPHGWHETMSGIARGLAYGIRHPVEFGKAMVDWETWSKDPARAAGHLVPDLLGRLATVGVVAVTKADDLVTVSHAGKRLTADDWDAMIAEVEARLDAHERSGPAPSIDNSIAALNNLLLLVDQTGARVREIVPDGSASPGPLGTKRDTAAKRILEEATAGDLAFHHHPGKRFKDLPGFSRDVGDMTIGDFFDRFGLHGELRGGDWSGSWPVGNPDGRIGDLKLDLVSIDDTTGRAVVWDLTSQLEPRHFRKTMLYARVLLEGLSERVAMVHVVETYHKSKVDKGAP